MTENEISYKIRNSIFQVNKTLGAGLLESVYEAALIYQLQKDGLKIKSQLPIPVFYDNVELGIGFRLDVLVEDKVIVEIKSVEEVGKIHYKQLLNYLKLTDLKLGLLVNFNTSNIFESIHRVVNNL